MPYLKCDQCDFALWFQNDMLFYLGFLQCVLMSIIKLITSAVSYKGNKQYPKRILN